jgi:TetR/AcrR family transcriptional regulator, transcriptional repressor for nem operon
MARPRAFDEKEVLKGAMHAFRRDGYGTVSIRHLEQATGLSAGSIYNHFGDKEGVFDAAFEHYIDSVLRRRIASYATQEAGLVGLRELFVTLLHEPGGERLGCLITNTAIEAGNGNEKHQKLVLTGFDILRLALLERLTDAYDQSKLCEGIEPAIASIKLLVLYQGLLVLIRAGHDKSQLQRAIDLEFDSLERK